jgi:anti-sigma factor RsiW
MAQGFWIKLQYWTSFREGNMHDVIENGLEEYLGGKVRRDFQAHLAQCAECRAEVRQFEEFSGLFQALREPEPVQPEPGFYFRLSQNIDAQRQPSIWSIFSLDAVFGRRVAFASLMMLALAGSFLISRETGFERLNMNSPEAVMAAHDVSVPHEPSADRDRMLVTLASYEQR